MERVNGLIKTYSLQNKCLPAVLEIEPALFAQYQMEVNHMNQTHWDLSGTTLSPGDQLAFKTQRFVMSGSVKVVPMARSTEPVASQRNGYS